MITNARLRPWHDAGRIKGDTIVRKRRNEELEKEAREYIANHKTGRTEISRRS